MLVLRYFFFILFFYNSIQIYQYVSDKYSYQYEDWLINYSNGFVRRGIIGEFLIQFSEFSGVNLQILVFILLILLLFFLYYYSFKLFSKIRINLIYLFLIFSPYFFIFYLANHNAGIRKEFFLFIFFGLIASIINLQNLKKKLWVFSVFFPFLIFIHEAIFFYLPIYIMVLLALISNKNHDLILKQIFITVLFSIIIFYLSFIFKGSEGHVKIICESLKTHVKETCFFGGAINHLKDKLAPSVKLVMYEHNLKSLAQWTLISLYSFAPILYLLKKIKFQKNNLIEKYSKIETKKFFLIGIILSFVGILPLFVVAFDWGRWLSMYYHTLAFFIIFLHKNKIIFLKTKFIKKINFRILLILIIYSTFVTPVVFDKVSSKDERPYKLNYINLIKKNFN